MSTPTVTPTISTAQTAFRDTVNAILNSIDRIRAGQSTAITDPSSLPRYRFAVVRSYPMPDGKRFDLVLTDCPRGSESYISYYDSISYWSRCDDREFLLGLANMGNAYIEIG